MPFTKMGFVLLALVATSSALQHAADKAPRARKDAKTTMPPMTTEEAAPTADAKMTATTTPEPTTTTKMPKATKTAAPTAEPTAAAKMTALMTTKMPKASQSPKASKSIKQGRVTLAPGATLGPKGGKKGKRFGKKGDADAAEGRESGSGSGSADTAAFMDTGSSATEKAAYSSGIALAVAGLLIAVGTTLRKRAEARTLALTEDTPLMGGTKVVVV